MRKNDLIKKLQAIKGNPEVVLWNGFVGDYQHLAEPKEGDLVKQTFEYYAESERLREAIKVQDWQFKFSKEEIEELKRDYKSFEYEQNSYVSLKDVKEGKYKIKRVIWLPAKLRGLKDIGHCDTLKY